MDYLYKLLPVELVSIIEKILHEMYFVDTIKKLNAINNLLLTEKYPRYTSYNNKSKKKLTTILILWGKGKERLLYE